MNSTWKTKIKVVIKPSECPYYRVDEEGNELCEFRNYLAASPPGIIQETVIEPEEDSVLKRELKPFIATSFVLTTYPVHKDLTVPCKPKNCFGRRLPLFYQLMKECFKSGVRKSITVVEEIPEEWIKQFLRFSGRGER